MVEDPDGPETGPRRASVPALEHVANRPIAHHVVDAMVATGIENIVVATSTQHADQVRGSLTGGQMPTRVRFQYVEDAAPLDLGMAVRLAAPLVGRAQCIVHSATGLMGEQLEPLLDHVDGSSPDAMLIVHQGPAAYGFLNSATRAMLHVAELDSQRDALGLAGVMMFGPGAIQHAADSAWWSGHEVDLTLIAGCIGASGGTLKVRSTRTWYRYSGCAHDLLDLNRLVLDRLESQHRRPEAGNRIEGRVHIDDTASINASVIVGPVVIGAGAQISDSYIGPYTAVGPDARIEAAEIERSIISSGATIRHIGSRLAGSVVGRNARVFRDFTVPRGMRLRVGDDTEVAFS